MAQTAGEGPNRGKGPGKYGGGRAPRRAAPKPKPQRRSGWDDLRPNAPQYRPKRTPVAPKSPSPPRQSYSAAPRNYGNAGGYSGSSRSGKSVGSNSTGRISNTAPAPPAAPPKPAITADQIAKTFNQWSGGDTVYKAQKDALAQALTDYTTRSTNEGNAYGIQNAANRKALVGERDQGKLDLINDFTARGMLGQAQQQAQSQFDTDWNKRFTDFDTAYNDWRGQQSQALEDYKRNNSLQLTKAQQDAIARRVASYGL